MGAVWNGKNEWSLRLGHTPRLRGWLGGLRHLRAADRAVWFPNRRRPVKLSPLADALAQLERIQIVPAVDGLPVDADLAAAGTLTAERVRLAAAGAGAGRARSVQSTREGGEG